MPLVPLSMSHDDLRAKDDKLAYSQYTVNVGCDDIDPFSVQDVLILLC